ncbi:hypothetical protein D3C81_1965930 [compost metagenome]
MQRGVGVGEVVGVKVQRRLELAEGAVNPRAHLVVGEADLAGGGVDPRVFVSLRGTDDAQRTRGSQQYSDRHRILQAGLAVEGLD